MHRPDDRSSARWVGEFDGGLVDHGALSTANGTAHLQLTFDDQILVVLRQSGDVVSFSIDNVGTGLTQADSVDIVGGTGFQASVVLPCAPP